MQLYQRVDGSIPGSDGKCSWSGYPLLVIMEVIRVIILNLGVLLLKCSK